MEQQNLKDTFPKGCIEKITGSCLVLPGDDIDTDRIIPARFLKCINFESLGEQVFADDRIEKNGSHPFDQTTNKDASILVVNENFGCGSSREHAPQALMRWGIRAIIGQSFAEIFFGNCLALGIPCMTTSASSIRAIQKEIHNQPNQVWKVDIANCLIKNISREWKVNIETGFQEMLLKGQWDTTAQLLSKKNELITTMNKLPYLNNFKSMS